MRLQCYVPSYNLYFFLSTYLDVLNVNNELFISSSLLLLLDNIFHFSFFHFNYAYFALSFIF